MNVYTFIENGGNFREKHSLTDVSHNARIQGVTVLATVARSMRPTFRVSIGQVPPTSLVSYESRN